MIDFSGKAVLMIGGVNDLAAGVAATFKRAGARVMVVHDFNVQRERLHAYPEAAMIEASLDDPETLASELERLTFDVVVICPGWFEHQAFLDSTVTDIEEAYRVNFEQATYAAQAAAKRLITLGQGGAMIFLSSVASKMPMVETNLAGSSLASLEVIATMSAVELAPHRIRVNVVMAGWIEGTWSGPLLGKNNKMKEASDIPAGKLGTAASVGNACCFLASPGAEYITGAVLPVDGGFMLTKSAVQSPYPGA